MHFHRHLGRLPALHPSHPGSPKASTSDRRRHFCSVELQHPSSVKRENNWPPCRVESSSFFPYRLTSSPLPMLLLPLHKRRSPRCRGSSSSVNPRSKQLFSLSARRLNSPKPNLRLLRRSRGMVSPATGFRWAAKLTSMTGTTVLLRIIRSHQVILDRLREARTAVGTEGFNETVHRDFASALFPYRLHSQRLARTLFYLGATSRRSSFLFSPSACAPPSPGLMSPSFLAVVSKTQLARDVPSSKPTWASFENDALVLSRRLRCARLASSLRSFQASRLILPSKSQSTAPRRAGTQATRLPSILVLPHLPRRRQLGTRVAGRSSRRVVRRARV